MSARVSLKDIARAVSVSVGTVSMALAGDHRISESTRQLVREAAERLGYIRDPRLSSIASKRFRHSGKPIRIAMSEDGKEWSRRLRPQTESMGMSLCVFDGPLEHLVEQALADEAAALIISRRGIEAGPLEKVDLPIVLWTDEGPDVAPIDVVDTCDWWAATTGAINRVKAAGYCQPAAVLTPAAPRHWHDDIRSACLAAHGIPTMEFDMIDASVLAFLDCYKPDCLIGGLSMVAQVLERHHVPIPVVLLLVADTEWERSYTGWVPDQEHRGQVTLELIEQRLRYGPRPPRRIVVPPRWQVGHALHK